MLARPLLLEALLLTTLAAQAEIITGRVVGVADGDTVTVLDQSNTQHKIRLAGIDAPEKAQAFGQRSKESLSDLLFDKTVTVDTDKRDRYGRKVGKILVDGTDANLVQIERGLAWHYKAYAHEQPVQDRETYAAAEVAARGHRRGLWRDAEPVAPWEFRRRGKQAQ